MSSKVLIDYTNYRGERAERVIVPLGSMRYGTSEWHKEPQWLLPALDVVRREQREFAMNDIHSWRPADE